MFSFSKTTGTKFYPTTDPIQNYQGSGNIPYHQLIKEKFEGENFEGGTTDTATALNAVATEDIPQS